MSLLTNCMILLLSAKLPRPLQSGASLGGSSEQKRAGLLRSRLKLVKFLCPFLLVKASDKASSHSRNRETNCSFWWKDLQSHIAMGISKGNKGLYCTPSITGTSDGSVFLASKLFLFPFSLLWLIPFIPLFIHPLIQQFTHLLACCPARGTENTDIDKIVKIPLLGGADRSGRR